MKRLTAGILMVLAVVAVSVVVTSLSGRSQASSDRQESQVTENTSSALLDRNGNTEALAVRQVAAQEAEDGKPFIGIAIYTVSNEEAGELGIDGGAVVRRVVEGSPADGLLMPDDVITAIAGNDVSSAADVIDLVLDSEPGDTLMFTVLRNGDTIDVEVTVGERKVEVEIEVEVFRQSGLAGPMSNPFMTQFFQGGLERFVRGEVVMETDDGDFKTIRAVSGKVQEGSVDEYTGTFTLMPKDGSDPIEYQVSLETAVFLRHKGNIGGLNFEQMTLVVDVREGDDEEGTVKLVMQGDLLKQFGEHSRGFFGGSSFGLHGFDEDVSRHQFGFGSRDFPELRERLHRLFPDGEGSDFHSREFGFGDMPDLDELFELLPDISGDTAPGSNGPASAGAQ